MKLIIKTLLLLSVSMASLQAMGQKFTASFTPAASAESFSGKVFLYLSKDAKSPKGDMVGVHSFPCFSIDVKNVKPGQKVEFDDKAISYPTVLSDIERGAYYAQVVWDKNEGGRAIAESPGNMFNNTIVVKITKDRAQSFDIVCSEMIKKMSFKETQFVKELKVPSALLTAFYKRPTTVNAAVLLPKGYYSQPNRKFPVLYWISGYGGDYHGYSGKDAPSDPIDTTACIRVFLDGNCPGGHCVYANSDNNGPWGDALTQELIPLVEKTYRTNPARLLTGHSSGGWTVLWLQTHYPKVFAACWSSSPDPVDFRSFQEVNLYSEKNIYYGKDSTLRLAGTIAGRFPWITMKNMCSMEHVIYRGEQMHSFNFVFSTRNPDSTPRSLWNDETGEIDAKTFEHWKNYDISLYLRSNWQQIKPDLQGKIRVTVGNQDNFLLNYAVHLLDGEMKKLDAGFVFEYYPGDHFTIHTPEYRLAGYRFLEQKYNELGIKN
ncbi:alpha/beta hydrolase-fold protein [Mucilaginibacter sp. BT774]|uniref:alpha/beta hydrolase-fold protein n=1 Tax=Mucilaginibacter sp. BT774 TaxID=3062276 RepID=UPI002674DCB7|nr:alpha/beta hydrolase-fold protein [Mucilaginibacter sp. BT774]MDO3628035.1 alpha/beta hydrolase-fold protein [Mucilaginibacter sp. BT774]